MPRSVRPRVVANSGPLNHRTWIARLGLLRPLYTQVLVPAGIQREVLRTGVGA